MRRVLRENGLSITLLSLFLLFWVGQSVVGHREHNSDQREHLQPEVATSPTFKARTSGKRRPRPAAGDAEHTLDIVHRNLNFSDRPLCGQLEGAA